MNSNRWLMIFAIILGMLVIATVPLVSLRGEKKVASLPKDSPQGSVQRYLIAIHEKDYQKAFGYLLFNPADKITTYNDWVQMLGNPQSGHSVWKATLGTITINGNYATVEVAIDTIHLGGLFGNSQYSQLIVFQLTSMGNSWFITSPTYVFWIY